MGERGRVWVRVGVGKVDGLIVVVVAVGARGRDEQFGYLPSEVRRGNTCWDPLKLLLHHIYVCTHIIHIHPSTYFSPLLKPVVSRSLTYLT